MKEKTKQTPDPRPGNYYVSAVDGSQTWLLLGPFRAHQSALNRVEKVRTEACKGNARAHFYGFGTLRMSDDYMEPGSANKFMPEELKEAA